MKLILKNFCYILRKFKTTSILVVLGLTAGITIFITAAIQCYHDFSYNRNFKNTDEIYLYAYHSDKDGWRGAGCPTMNDLQSIKNTYPSIVDFCVINDWKKNTSNFYFGITEEDMIVETRVGVTEGFVSLFNPKVIIGDVQRLFTEPDKIMLTQSVAKKIFGNENPVEKVIISIFFGRTQPCTVVAVCEDFPDNCFLKNGVYYYANPDYEQGANVVYMRISKSDTKSIAKSLERGEYLDKKTQEDIELRNSINPEKVTAHLIPLTEVYFSGIGKDRFASAESGSLATTLSLLFVGLLALVIAYINFINFWIAMSPTRVRSLNIQKIFGARESLLRFTLASESAIFSLIAFLLAVVCVNVVHKSISGDLFSADLSVASNWKLLVFTGIFVTLAGLIMGLYPAYYATSFKPVLTLSGSFSRTKKNTVSRNILTTIQFSTAIALVIVVAFVKWQNNYVVNHTFFEKQKERIVYLPLSNLGDSHYGDRKEVSTLVSELKRNPMVLDCAASSTLPGQVSYVWNSEKPENVKIQYTVWFVSNNFLQFFGIPLAEGVDFPNFTQQLDKQSIVNKKFIEDSGMIDPADREIDGMDIIGVINDFTFENLHRVITPMAFVAVPDFQNGISYLYIKITGNDIPRTIADIKDTWKNISSAPFELKFLDEHIESIYKKENKLANLLTMFSTIAIVIAIMGVYGLISFNIRLKKKEIALRKISGANLNNILLMLNQSVLIQLLVAFVAATPVAYFIVSHWLGTFAYRISIRWWVFVLCWLFVFIVTALTIITQTIKAANENPIDALKTE